jgi:basic membrane lipoprotein Med (substrate-binding protein (PBP1-ABC) superfamily)
LDGEPGAGIGAPCEEDGDCQGAQCIDEVCAAACSAASDCPAPSVCTGAGLCQLPLRAGFVYIGLPEVEQWTQAHEIGRVQAEEALPYLETEAAEGKLLAADAASAIDDFIQRGFHVVVATSPSLRDVAAVKAAEHPEVKFLSCGALSATENNVSYYGRMYQATYLAGFAAARRSATKRLGMVGSLVTPSVVRHINAFATGARRAEPNAVVEVRWIGFWHDTGPPDAQGRTKERALTEELLSTGCDVIAHQADNGVPVATVAEVGGSAKAIGNNVAEACPEGSASCLGATYWQWGPMYIDVLDGLHRSRWPGGQLVNAGIEVSPAGSVVNFGLNVAVGTTDLAIEISGLLEEVAGEGGVELPFRGPLCSTGQRTPVCLEAGEVVSEEELLGMCWFVEGIVEKEDAADPGSADRAAMVPGQGDCAP